jgi:transposase InsO family protein
VWTWDITYLQSSVRGEFFYLYLVLDLWSRKIVDWRVEERESDEFSSEMIQRSCEILGIDPDQLTLHSDNGGPMKGATMLATLLRLGVAASFSRPRVSNDNPFSEALFRTAKYRPDYPNGPFTSIEEARAWVAGFVTWYNTVHQHSAIRYVTPDDRYTGRERDVLARRRQTYEQARRRNPARWSGPTRNWTPVGAVYLNPVTDELTYAEVV